MRASYKTYRGQKNFYDKNNMHKNLGEVFFYWYICGTKNEQQIQRAYREADRSAEKFCLTNFTEFASSSFITRS